jgi:flagellar basal-body rod modification protein FlgD
MASVGNVATLTGTATAATASKSAVEEQQDRFLKLLVTQMKNQDPLNPLDNAQVTTQMAQLSTVSGIEKLNATMQALTKSQAFQAAGLIGHYVLAPGDFINLKGGVGAAGVDLAGPADSVKVRIMNAQGVQVRELDLGKRAEGPLMFQWDGLTAGGVAAPDGAYSFAVTAVQAGKQVVPVALSVGQVTSVLMDAAGPALSVQGMGEIGLDQVRQIL